MRWLSKLFPGRVEGKQTHDRIGARHVRCAPKLRTQWSDLRSFVARLVRKSGAWDRIRREAGRLGFHCDVCVADFVVDVLSAKAAGDGCSTVEEMAQKLGIVLPGPGILWWEYREAGCDPWRFWATRMALGNYLVRVGIGVIRGALCACSDSITLMHSISYVIEPHIERIMDAIVIRRGIQPRNPREIARFVINNLTTRRAVVLCRLANQYSATCINVSTILALLDIGLGWISSGEHLDISRMRVFADEFTAVAIAETKLTDP